MQPLDRWIERQYRHSAAGMLRSVSPAGIVKMRPGFGQRIRPREGSIVASPVPGSYDPEPDYFFHWYRDSALVVDALRLLSEDKNAGIDATSLFADFVHFSLELNALDGRAITITDWRSRVAENFVQYLRTDSELESIHGDAVAAETRVNPDGTLDVSRWPRPQYDGPALRALRIPRGYSIAATRSSTPCARLLRRAAICPSSSIKVPANSVRRRILPGVMRPSSRASPRAKRRSICSAQIRCGANRQALAGHNLKL